MKSLIPIACFTVFFIAAQAQNDNRLAKASREDRSGWINIHLEGSPATIGYQHGFLMANEIDTTIQACAYWLDHETHYPWSFYRDAAKRFLWKHVEEEYKTEIDGIVAGLKAKGKKYDRFDITAYNALEELAFYYVPQLMDAIKPHSGDNKAPGNCSAFIATGSHTKDGKIVMGHNNWTEYIWGQHWNVIADVVPQKGHRFIMDCMPGFLHSGDDFVISSSGILITETTITQFKGFDTTGVPEFVRARKASQYANNIDDVIRIFVTGNNGGYANDWLIGDIKTNEVAKLELGLKNHRVWRSKDTAMIGSNFASDPKLIAEETTFDAMDLTTSPNARKTRMESFVISDLKGKLDEETGKQVEGDHLDATTNAIGHNRHVVCGHIEEDPVGCPEWDCAPFDPMGAVQGKVTTSDMAAKLQLWAHMGHPCGQSFIGETFYKEHPEWAWQSKYLKNMYSWPWAKFSGK
jgi:hypothetical protein